MAPPTAPAIKLNVNGSSLGNQRQSGYGGILPNNKGKWLLGFMGYSGYIINMNAEISTTYHGLHFVWEARHYFSGFYSSSCTTCVSDQEACLFGLEFYIHSSLCEGNSCADWFAK